MLLDSPFWVVPPEPPVAVPWPLVRQTQAVLGFANTTAVQGEACRMRHPEPEHRWRCLFAQFRLPFVAQPYVLHTALYDAFQIEQGTGACAVMRPWAWALSSGVRFPRAMGQEVANVRQKSSLVHPSSSVRREKLFRQAINARNTILNLMTCHNALCATGRGRAGTPRL